MDGTINSVLGNSQVNKVSAEPPILYLNPTYMTKPACLGAATALVAKGQISVTDSLITAQEIYTHAYAYYSSSALLAIGISKDDVQYLHDHANPVNIGGNTPEQVAIYVAVWTLL